MPGDVVLAVTDGVLRAANPDGAELGLERLEERAVELRRRPLDQLAGGVLDLAREFSAAADPVDAQAVLALRFSRED